jgi:flagellar M-ring protein FliF
MEGAKRIVEAPSPERVRAIKDIVAAAVGFQQERGDQIIVEALPFESTRNVPLVAAAPAAPSRPRLHLPAAIPDWLRVPMEGHLNWLVEQNWLPGVVLVLVLGLLFGLYKLLRKIGGGLGRAARAVAGKMPKFGKKKKGQHVDVTLDPSIEGGAAGPAQLAAGETAAVVHKSLDEQLRERDELQETLTRNAMMELDVPKAEVRRGEVLTRHIIEMVEKDPAAVANLVRTWVEGNGN